jgi:hypothetical protein
MEHNHPVCDTWELVGTLDLMSFLAVIGSVLQQAGRPAFDPYLFISVRLYPFSRVISSAREIAQRYGYDPSFQ